MTYNEFRRQALSNPEIKAEFEELIPKYSLMRTILNVRIKKNDKVRTCRQSKR